MPCAAPVTMIARPSNLPIRAESTPRNSLPSALLMAQVVLVEVDAIGETVLLAVEARGFMAGQVAVVAREIAIAFGLDMVEAAIEPAIFTVREAAVTDALVDAGLLIVNAVLDFAGTCGKRNERNESGGGNDGFVIHAELQRGGSDVLESTQFASA